MKRTKHHIGSTKAKRRAALLEGCLVHHQGEKALRAVRNKRRAELKNDPKRLGKPFGA